MGANQDPALQNLPGEYVEQGGVVAANSTITQKVDPNKKLAEDDQYREILANIYTFVRSQEINRVIGGFTFDHYIDEAKRRLKGTGRQLVDAAGKVISQDVKVGTRSSQLDYLNQIEQEFKKNYQEILNRAKKADA